MKRIPVVLAFLILGVLLSALLASCSGSTTTSPAATAPASGSPVAQTKVTLRLVIPVPPGDKLTVNAEELAQGVYQRTNGRYEIKVYSGEALAKVPEYLDAVRTGTVEMASVGLGMFAGIHPELAEIPMIYNNVSANAAACRPMAELYNTVLTKKANQRVLATYTTGANDLVSKREVSKLEDWKGLLVGTVTPELSAMASNFGAAPVVMG